jgi:hypothetical protein
MDVVIFEKSLLLTAHHHSSTHTYNPRLWRTTCERAWKLMLVEGLCYGGKDISLWHSPCFSVVQMSDIDNDMQVCGCVCICTCVHVFLPAVVDPPSL